MAELGAAPDGKACQINQVSYKLKQHWPEDALLPAQKAARYAADGLCSPEPRRVGG